jgi:hypothetical protein
MAIPSKNFKSNYVSWQAKVWMGPRVEHEYTDFDEDGIMQGKGPQFFVGNVPKATLTLAPEKFIHSESFTGDRTDDLVKIRKRSGKLTITLEDLTSKRNLAAILNGSPRLISTGSASAVFLLRYRATDKTYIPLKTGLPTEGEKYFFGYRGTDGAWYPYKNIASSSLTLVDSAGSPTTLVLDEDYSVVSFRKGQIKILDTAGLTGPVKASFTYGLIKDKLPPTINTAGSYKLSHTNISDAVIKDSAGTPATVSTSYYDIDTDSGFVSFKSLSAFEAAAYTMPLVVEYTANDSTVIPFLGDDPQREYVVTVAGIDTNNNNDAAIWDCYRVQWQSDAIELINTDLGSVTITGDLLQDPDMDSDDPFMGNLGKLTINKRDVSS